MMQLEAQEKQFKAGYQPERETLILNMKNLQQDDETRYFEFQLSNIQRNAYITVYKDIQRESHNSINQMIQKIINRMADQQRIVKLNNQDKKEAIKQISTTVDINPNLQNSFKEIQNFLKINNHFLNNKLMQTLIKYMIEIQERQYEGQINNALIMIQQDIIGINPMCAATAFFRSINIENSKFNQSRPLKIAYINLTLNDSLNNVELWHKCTENAKNQSAYISIFIRKNCDLNQYSRIPSFYLYPIEEPQDKILTRMQLRTIFKYCIRNHLETFNPQVISLSISYNQEYKINLEELQNVVRKLCQMSNNKLIIHINFDQITETTPNVIIQEEFTSLVNCIYQGMQFIRIPKMLEIIADPKNTIEWLRKTSQYLLDYHQTDNARVLQRYANSLDVMKPQFRNEKKEITSDFQEGKLEKYIGYYLGNKFILFQVRFKDQQVFLFKTTQVFLNHEEQILAIYDEKLQQAYYGNLQEIKPNNVIEVELIQNLPKLINPSLLIIKKYIIFAYGTLYQQSKFKELNESIYCFDFISKRLIECKQQRVIKNQNLFETLYLPSKKNQTTFDLKSSIQWKYDGEVQQNRQSPGVAKTWLLKDNENTVDFMLIGGEGIKGVNQIQNIIECISLNLQDQTYIAGIIDKVSLHRFPTFKPFAHQIILDSKKENGEKTFIILPGNLNMFQEYYKQPINQSYAEKATMINVSQKEGLYGIDISEVQIQYDSENLLNLPISLLLNNQNNFQIIRNDEDQIVWRLNSSAIAYYPKLVKLKSDIEYQHNQQMEQEQDDGYDQLMLAQNLQIEELAKSQAGEKSDDKSQKMIQEVKGSQKLRANAVINQSVLFNYFFIIKFELQLKTNILNIIETTVLDNQYLEIDSSQLIQNK